MTVGAHAALEVTATVREPMIDRDRPQLSNAVVGDELRLRLTATNNGSPTQSNVTLRLYFVVLPKAFDRPSADFVSSSPSGCIATTLGTQGVIDCPVASLADGETVAYDVLIQTNADSRGQMPPQVHLAQGNSQISDENGPVQGGSFINVSADVLTDSDGDGVSDFNEELAGTNKNDSNSTPGASTISVLALVSPGTAAAVGNTTTRINHLMTVTNTISTNSGMDITFQLAGAPQDIAADDTQTLYVLLDRMRNNTNAFTNIETLRANADADLVVLFAPSLNGSPICGLAALLGAGRNGDFGSTSNQLTTLFNDSVEAYGTVYADCRDRVTAHEIGHIMGLAHDVLDFNFAGTFNFSSGYGVDNSFATVMGGAASYGTAVEIDLFSDPALTCLSGQACGIGRLNADLDVDGNGAADANTDGKLVLRYLFGFRGNDLIDGVVGSGATRTSASAIESHIASIVADLDVDGDGSALPLSDGVLASRGMLGDSGAALTDDALPGGATRTAAQIRARLALQRDNANAVLSLNSARFQVERYRTESP
jgi:hypothetical protein